MSVVVMRTGVRRARRPARLLAVAAATVFGMAGLATADPATADPATAAAPWVPSAVYGEGGAPQAFDVAVTPDGGRTVTWAGGSESDPRSVVQRSVPGGAPPTAPARMVPAGTPGGAMTIVPLTASESVALVVEPDIAASRTTLRLRKVDGSGTPGATLPVVTDISDAGGIPALAGNGNGSALVAWIEPGEGAFARMLRGDGTLTPPVRVGDGGFLGSIGVSLLPDGTGHVVVDTGAAVTVARVDAQGAVDGAPQPLAPPGAAVLTEALGTGPGGAAVTWHEPTGDGQIRVRAARLPTSGPVVGTTRTVADSGGSSSSGASRQATAVSVAADGGLTVVWAPEPSGPEATPLRTRWVPPSGAMGPITDLSDGLEADQAEGFARLVPSGNGRLRAVWLRAGNAASQFSVLSRSVATDGTLGTQGTVTEQAVGPVLRAAADTAGTVTVAWLGAGADQDRRVETALLDESPPTATIAGPRAAVVGQRIEFRVDAFDSSGIADVRWEFGDRRVGEGTTVTHAYERPGYFDVAVTVTDRSGNEAVAYQTVHVTEPVAPPPPDGQPPAWPPPPGAPQPPGGRTPSVTRTSPALRLRTVKRTSRKARTVRVAGTVSRKAGGRVTITWRQKVGRRTVTRTVRTRISRGRYSARVRLTASMARARTRATVTVRYAGDADTRAAAATKRVTPPRR